MVIVTPPPSPNGLAPRRTSTPTVLLPNPQHQDTLERLTEGEIQELNVNFDENINFKAEHNSRFLRTNSSLNSTLPQCGNTDR